MPVGNPQYMGLPGSASWGQTLLRDKQFQDLSPESQTLLSQYAQTGIESGGLRGVVAFRDAMQKDPALQRAMAEAKEKQALGEPMSGWEKLLIGGVAAAMTLGVALPAIAGIGGAVLGPTGAAASVGSVPASLAAVAPAATTGSTLATLSGIARVAGPLVSGATQAATSNRGARDDANQQAGRDFENQQVTRAQLEDQQRRQAMADVYRASWYKNRQAGPYNTQALPTQSPEFMQALSATEKAALERLLKPPEYSTTTMNALRQFQPSRPSTGERVGTVAAPILSGLANWGR